MLSLPYNISVFSGREEKGAGKEGEFASFKVNVLYILSCVIIK
jgi:hypothetical protein